MKTDRELLELAAKAAGTVLIPYTWTGWDHDGFTAVGLGGYEWNPLDDDGQALQLAVKRKIDVWWAEDGSKVFAQDANGLKPAITVAVKDCSTEEEATRRAIVRAAAAIGEAMP